MKGIKEMRLRYISYGLRESHKRFHEYLKTTDKQYSSPIVSSLTELLMWISVSNEWHYRNNNAENKYEDLKIKDPGGQCVEGLRYAFNSLKHEMTFIKLISTKGENYLYADRYLEDYSTDSIWLKADGLIEYNRRYENDRENYKKYIEGKTVVETVDKACKFLIDEYNKVK